MSLREKVIVTDFDGVCGDWSHTFNMNFIELGFKPKNLDSYDVNDKFHIPNNMNFPEKIVENFNSSDELKRIPPFKDAIKYIRKLHEEHGYVFHCITAIQDTRKNYKNRMKNIHNLFGVTAFEKLILSESSLNKKKFLEPYRDSGCFWIEDVVPNAEFGIELGMDCLLVVHEHNKEEFVRPEIRKVHNWKEIYSCITGE